MTLGRRSLACSSFVCLALVLEAREPAALVVSVRCEIHICIYKKIVQRLLVMGGDVDIELGEVESALSSGAEAGTATHGFMAIPLNLPLRDARAEFERNYLRQQLNAAEGSIVELARRVGMERTHLYRKLRSLGIDTGKHRG